MFPKLRTCIHRLARACELAVIVLGSYCSASNISIRALVLSEISRGVFVTTAALLIVVLVKVAHCDRFACMQEIQQYVDRATNGATTSDPFEVSSHCPRQVLGNF